jgi:hypothetical protein
MPKRTRDDTVIRTKKYSLGQREPNKNPEDSGDETGKIIREPVPEVKIIVPAYSPDIDDD